MSALPAGPNQSKFQTLRELDIELIDPNPENPRLVFPQDELDRLAESIDHEGILVPIVVYEQGKRFVLIDGERRFKCAQTLGLATVPAVITQPRTLRENLVQMFNIHLIREQWQDIPTARAIERLARALEDENGNPPTEAELANLTGLSRERLSRLRHAVTLPSEYQKYISEGLIPLNWFWELKKSVIEPLARQRPKLAEEFSESAIREAFVGKRLDGVITDTVSLRDVRPIISLAAKDADTSPAQESVLDETIRGLITDPGLTIKDAYEDSVQIIVEADKLERRTKNMLASFSRLLTRVRTADERRYVVDIGNKLVSSLRQLLRQSAGG